MVEFLAFVLLFEFGPFHFESGVLLVGENGLLLDGVVAFFGTFVVVETGLFLLLLVLLEDLTDGLGGLAQGALDVGGGGEDLLAALDEGRLHDCVT